MMTTEERKVAALKLFTDLENLLANLYDRWSDEKDYEDINDYAVNIKPKVEAIGGSFIQMMKRPFGFTFGLSDATYQIKVNGSNYSYKRIK